MKNSFFFFLFITLFFSVPSTRAEVLVPILIARGGNLIHIARDYCNSRNDWKELARINNLKEPYLIYPGETLQIPMSLLLTEKISAKVGSVSGGVFLLENGSQLKQLKKGDTVLPGQTVVTEKESFAHLIFPDNKYTRIASESRFTITYLVRLTDKSTKAEFYLERGRIVQAVKKQLGRNESFTTRTLLAVTGVRGTEYRLKIEEEGGHSVETLSGIVGVEGAKGSIDLKEGQGIHIVEGMALGKAETLPIAPPIPKLSKVYRTLPVVLPTLADKRFSSLRLRVCTDRQGKETILEQIIEPGEKFTLLALADRTYFGFLTSSNQQNFESPPIGPFFINVRTVPVAPILSMSLKGKVLFDKNVSHSWLKGAQTENYFLQLAKDKEFKEIVEEKIQYGTDYTTPSLELGEYFFRLQAIAKDGFRSDFSLLDSWKVSKIPSLGELESSSGDGVSLRWSSMGKGIVYDLQVSRDKEFKDLLVDQSGLQVPSFDFAEDPKPAQYYVRIRGVLGDGQVSPWTPYQVLKIDPEPPGLIEAGIILIFILGVILV